MPRSASLGLSNMPICQGVHPWGFATCSHARRASLGLSNMPICQGVHPWGLATCSHARVLTSRSCTDLPTGGPTEQRTTLAVAFLSRKAGCSCLLRHLASLCAPASSQEVQPKIVILGLKQLWLQLPAGEPDLFLLCLGKGSESFQVVPRTITSAHFSQLSKPVQQGETFLSHHYFAASDSCAVQSKCMQRLHVR
eukprot:1142035-Pelagomonas_calceolata.AAC.1